MDPYLEDPRLWPDAHHELISTYRALLNRVIRPKYVARVEERLYMVADDDPELEIRRVPDIQIEKYTGAVPPGPNGASAGLMIAGSVVVRTRDPIREGRVEIREVDGGDVVTVIELLSPSNKLPGAAGRQSFLKKRAEVLASSANWVEIDLLRVGTSHPIKRRRFAKYEYLVYSSPANSRPDGKAWPIRLQDPLPVVGIPLRDPDPDAPLDLQAALALAYDRAAYDATADYTKDPDPPLPPELAAWADELLKQQKLR